MKRFSQRNMMLLSLLLASVLLGSVLIANPPGTIPHGLKVENLPLAGLTVEQALNAWTSYEKQRLSKTVTLYHEEAEPSEHSYTYQELGMTANAGSLLNDLTNLQKSNGWKRWKHRWAIRNRHYDIHWSLPQAKMYDAVTKNWRLLEDQQPQNARREITEYDEVRYQEGISVQRIDFLRLQAELLKHVTEEASYDLHLPLKIVYPEITLEHLQNQGIERKITEFTTYFRQSGAGRVHNIQSTAHTVHDYLLAPGEIFDYGEVVQDTEKAFGFKPAPVIINGRLVQGIGGGICQVSTTLYNAALRSGLEIVERRNHSIPVKYVPLGQDATFASGHINFRFRNTLDSHLLIRTETSDHHITVKFFGSQSPDRTYRIQSERVEHLPSPVRYIANPSLRDGERVILKKGKDGFVIKTTRVHVEKGVNIEEEEISRDRYAPTPTVVSVRNPPKDQLYKPKLGNGNVVEDGVH